LSRLLEKKGSLALIFVDALLDQEVACYLYWYWLFEKSESAAGLLAKLIMSRAAVADIDETE